VRTSPPAAFRASASRTGPALRDRWRRGQRGWPPSFPLAELPNASLLVAVGGWLVAAVTDGSVHSYARATFYTGLAARAWDELAGGANWARRALGGAGLVYVIVKVATALGHDDRSPSFAPAADLPPIRARSSHATPHQVSGLPGRTTGSNGGHRD
jgi:hypothetical protein